MTALQRNIEALRGTLDSIGGLGELVEQAGGAVADALLGGDKVLACGNGGSAADAAHFTTELVGRFTAERRGYPAICLNTHGGDLTALGNDYGFDRVFSRQVEAIGLAGDVLVAITTSGASANVRAAIQSAGARGMTVITVLGRDGGACRGLGDIELIVPGSSTARIQEAHQLLLHTITEVADERLLKV